MSVQACKPVSFQPRTSLIPASEPASFQPHSCLFPASFLPLSSLNINLSTAGAETSQSNGNAQILYSFIRGAGKQYAVPWYGQVSIFNWFGYKIPGDPEPTHPPGADQCRDQSSHSESCGTSLSLMKRLMYTQLLYDSVLPRLQSG